MSNKIHFEVQRGTIVSDCMEETYQFISNNLKYLHDSLKPIRDEVLDDSNFTFIGYEENWSFATTINKVELGKVSSGHGVILEGNQCSYSDLLHSME